MANLLTAASVMMCPHGGTVNAISSNTKAKAAGSYLLRSTDTFTIVGCSLNVAAALHPCVQVQWVQTALKSKAIGDFHLTMNSVGLCVAADQAVQGTVLINTAQPKVSGR
jgi:Na+/phosphate symporter